MSAFWLLAEYCRMTIPVAVVALVDVEFQCVTFYLVLLMMNPSLMHLFAASLPFSRG